MQALIGYTGAVGRTLLDQTQFDAVYNSANIRSMQGRSYDLVVCAAPSGSRLLINQDSAADTQSIALLESVLSTCKIGKLVLCSTVDAVNWPTTPYGANRLKLEQFVLQNFDSAVFRLSSLVGQHIKKNCLYDMANGVYVEKINPLAVLQWYPLRRLWSDIQNNLDQPVTNLVSEPIVTQEIADRFFDLELIPRLPPEYRELRPYCSSREEIFAAIEEYLK